MNFKLGVQEYDVKLNVTNTLNKKENCENKNNHIHSCELLRTKY